MVVREYLNREMIFGFGIAGWRVSSNMRIVKINHALNHHDNSGSISFSVIYSFDALEDILIGAKLVVL